MDLIFTDVFRIGKIRGCYLLLKGDTVVYVGQSKNIMGRIGKHISKDEKEFDGFSYAVIPEGDLNEIEAELIVKHKPIYNNAMPVNSKYESLHSIRVRLGVRIREMKKILKKISPLPVWRDYYSKSDFEGAK